METGVTSSLGGKDGAPGQKPPILSVAAGGGEAMDRPPLMCPTPRMSLTFPSPVSKMCVLMNDPEFLSSGNRS